MLWGVVMSDTIWSEIKIHTTHEATEAVSNILHEVGAGGVVIEDSLMLTKEWDTPYGEIYSLSPDDYPEEGVYVKAYFPLNSFLGDTIDQIRSLLDNLTSYGIDFGSGDMTVAEINQEDWADSWKKYYKPIAITERITITPSWETYERRADEIVVELDPGMAFGTGTHPTTKLSITALEKYLQQGDSVYDVGCGSGVLSIVAAKLGAGSVTAFDIDPIAVQSSELNVSKNDVDGVVETKLNNLLDGLEEPVQVIVANILADIILSFTKNIAPLLTSGGYFIGSGIILQKEDEIKAALEEAGLTVLEITYEGDWLVVIAQKKV